MNVGYGTCTHACSAPDPSGHLGGHGYSAGALVRLLAHALDSNRLDQARMVILDVSDPRSQPAAGHPPLTASMYLTDNNAGLYILQFEGA